MKYRIMLGILVCAVAWAEVKIVPPPKELRDAGRECRLARVGGAVIVLGTQAGETERAADRERRLAQADGVVIVIGAQAGETERAAAERLQMLILRRFKLLLEIVSEGDASSGQKQQILLGLPSTHSRLATLLSDKELPFSSEKLGPDGYLLEMVATPAGDTVVIAGGGPRGVLYGQDVFFDLLEQRGEEIIFPAVSVRDWPSIPWRGRPHSVLAHHLEPGAMDSYVRSRLNFTDVRDDPRVKATPVYEARKASMGCPAGIPLDQERMSQHIANAHRYGFFVYGTVACAVSPERYDKVLATYRDLLALGVDGLWISFDDSGAGTSPCAIIQQVLALGAEHGISGRAIAITPPLKEYQTIDRPLNREMAAVPGMADATWFFTRVPCAADKAMARDIGLSTLPAWWHNLVNIMAGFTHSGEVVAPLRQNNLPGYLELQPLASGWGRPKYDAIRAAASQTSTVLLWGLCSGFPQEYELAALGYWAWDPQRHDWDDTRDAIYRYVYGPLSVADARLFDDRMLALKAYYQLPSNWQFVNSPLWPWRLKDQGARALVLQHINEMKTIYARLSKTARMETALDPTRLERVYLEPMAATLRIAQAMAEIEYPEYTLPRLESDMLDLMESGTTAAMEATLRAAQKTLLPEVERIQVKLDGLKALEPYLEKWRARLSGLDYWRKFREQRTAGMRSLFNQQMKRPVAELLPYLPTANEQDWLSIFDEYGANPAGNVLSSFASDEWLKQTPVWRGSWGVGLYTNNATTTTALVFPDRTASAAGEYAEVTASIAVPLFQKRLLLDVFVQDSRRDNQWKGYRFLQLWADQSLIWSEDIARDRTGRAWVTADITKIARPGAELRLRFRVEDRNPVGNHLTVAFVGPFQLREE